MAKKKAETRKRKVGDEIVTEVRGVNGKWTSISRVKVGSGGRKPSGANTTQGALNQAIAQHGKGKKEG